MSGRVSIQPTYDSRETGPRYHVTVRVCGQTVIFERPLDDPFVRETVTTSWLGLILALLRFRPLVTEVIVAGDPDLMNDVLELDANCLVAGSTRQATFRSHVNERLGAFLNG